MRGEGLLLNLNGIRIESASLSKITPLYIETIPQAPLEKMVRVLEQGRYLSNHIILEKDPREDKYWLITGFLEYRAYCQFKERGAHVATIPCIIQPCSNDTEQRLQLLSRMFHSRTVYWIDKHNVIQQMIHKGETTAAIARKVGVAESDIKRYLIHPDIPEEIIEEAFENQGSFINLEQIRNLRLDPFLTLRLYRRAVLQKRNPNRLTTEKLQKIKWLLMRDNFYELKREDQWDLLSDALNYREKLEAVWDQEIREKLRRRSPKIFKMRIPILDIETYPQHQNANLIR